MCPVDMFCLAPSLKCSFVMLSLKCCSLGRRNRLINWFIFVVRWKIANGAVSYMSPKTFTTGPVAQGPMLYFLHDDRRLHTIRPSYARVQIELHMDLVLSQLAWINCKILQLNSSKI